MYFDTLSCGCSVIPNTPLESYHRISEAAKNPFNKWAKKTTVPHGPGKILRLQT